MWDKNITALLPSSSWFPSLSATTIALYILGAALAAVLGLYIYLWPLRSYRLSFRNLPGPPPDHWLLGIFPTLKRLPPGAPDIQWAEEYGHTFQCTFPFGTHRIQTVDPTALSFILFHSDIFPKPALVRRGLGNILGNGLVVAEGETHRRQRKALSPSFSATATKGMMPIFYDKSNELKARLLAIVTGDDTEEPSPAPETEEERVQGGRKVDMLRYLSKTMLDIIGLAGFNFEFNALSEIDNELARAYMDMFQSSMGITTLVMMQQLVPILKLLPTKRAKAIAYNKKVTQKFGTQIIQDKKRQVLETHFEGVEKNDDIGNDLLSILIKANMASDVKPADKLTDEEVLNQITTFMLAGNETSSTALTWLLYCLALNPDSQTRLRDEVRAVDDDRPSLETLNSLPYLDAAVNEALRLYSPINGTAREAKKDVIVPLGSPIKGRDGSLIESLKVDKGTMILIPITAVNCSTAIWGPDAKEFRPERFLHDAPSSKPEPAKVPGVWGNILTFLGGPRNCIGYRFALAEMKVILFVLMRSFEFQELKSKPVIAKKSAKLVLRPVVKGEETLGLQMPLMVKPILN